MNIDRLAMLGVLALASAPVAADRQGELIWRDPSCYFFVLKTNDGYGLYEFLGGPSPLVGHIFGGKLEGFGTRRIDNLTEGKPTMVYSEVYEKSARTLLYKIPKQCRRKKELEDWFRNQAQAESAS